MTGEVDLWLATRNPKKAAELRRLLSDRVRIRTLSELPGADELEVVEDAPDFRGNAAKKALAVAAFRKTHAPGARQLVLADDSGLCVDALGGAPGVLSARYCGPDASDADRNQRLLTELVTRDQNDRALGPQRLV